MHYNLLDPSFALFSKVKELRQLIIATNNPYSPAYIIIFGLQLIKNTRDFEYRRITWRQHPQADNIWVNNQKLEHSYSTKEHVYTICAHTSLFWQD